MTWPYAEIREAMAHREAARRLERERRERGDEERDRLRAGTDRAPMAPDTAGATEQTAWSDPA